MQPCSQLAFDKQNKNISCVCDLLANCVLDVWNSNGFICLLVFELMLHHQLLDFVAKRNVLHIRKVMKKYLL